MGAPYLGGKTCPEIYGALGRFAPSCAPNRKSITAESGQEGTCISACISESTIAMEIGHLVSYSKEPEGLCSAGCAFVACSVLCLRSSL